MAAPTPIADFESESSAETDRHFQMAGGRNSTDELMLLFIHHHRELDDFGRCLEVSKGILAHRNRLDRFNPMGRALSAHSSTQGLRSHYVDQLLSVNALVSPRLENSKQSIRQKCECKYTTKEVVMCP